MGGGVTVTSARPIETRGTHDARAFIVKICNS